VSIVIKNIRPAQRGFSLIELSLTITLSAIIALMLYQSFSYLQKSTASLKGQTEEIQSIELFITRLTRDLSAIMVPAVFYDSPAFRTPPAPGAAEKEEQKTEEKKKKDEAPPPFVLTISDSGSVFSCVTTTSTGPQEERTSELRRVTYRTMPSDLIPGTFTLLRSDTLYLPKNSKQTPTTYAFAGPFTEISYTFHVAHFDEAVLAAPTQKEREKLFEEWQKEPQYRRLTSWDSTPDSIKKHPPLPHFIEVTGTFYRTATHREGIPFSFFVEVAAAENALITWITKLPLPKKAAGS
jgi:prepilin-type N-terminal cleavage/methylation domain-containing protein